MILELDKKAMIKQILNEIPNQDFEVKEIFGNDFFSGIAVVRNNKLAGRLEDVKFLESFEPNLKKQFLKEGKILAAMHHSNIPKIYDIVEHNDMILFRTEHIEGYSLKEVLDAFRKKGETIPSNVATTIILKLSKALFYAHNEVEYAGKLKSIIHCDIKPSNIILSVKGCKRKKSFDDDFLTLVKENKVEPYLIDFGIANFKGERSNKQGTLRYMSSCQVRGEDLDWRSDVYQLLLVLYEMLTDCVPFKNYSKKKILEVKKTCDFEVNTKHNVSNTFKKIIEKGTKKDSSNSFKSEKEYLNQLKRIDLRERNKEFTRRNKLCIFSCFLICLVMFTGVIGYEFWDYHTQSVDAIVLDVEKKSFLDEKDLDLALENIQKRSFEEEYYKPLIAGKFRDKVSGEPIYPSSLAPNGDWIFKGADSESAGIFVGLLFSYSDKYPDILKYALEYAEPILKSEFDKSNDRRFMYALIPSYEKTSDERYLNKLINVTDKIMLAFNERKGVNQIVDLSHYELFLYVYNKTGDIKYLNTYEKQVQNFIVNNIDDNGYVYEYSMINATTPYGVMPDAKYNHLTKKYNNQDIGRYAEVKVFEEKNFMSVFSRDLMEMLLALDNLYDVTGNVIYKNTQEKVENYYIKNMPSDYVDFLFVSGFDEYNKNDDMPKDLLATIKSLHYFKENDRKIYYEKLKMILSSEYFRKEKEYGILKQSVIIENVHYIHSDKSKRNQTLIVCDKMFLELNR